jgi:ribosomal RNA-processing protein 36
MPLGALVKARKVVRTTTQDSDEQREVSGSEQESEVEEQVARAITSAPKERRPIEHRSNKHAYVTSSHIFHACSEFLILHSPMEVTSKKPVPRRRQVVEVYRVVRTRCGFLS